HPLSPLFSLLPPPPPRSPLFPYTTLFRSHFGRVQTEPLSEIAPAMRLEILEGIPDEPVGQRVGFTPGLELQQQTLAQVPGECLLDRKSTRLNSSHVSISYAVFCLKKKKNK